jgi:hypothetical protein
MLSHASAGQMGRTRGGDEAAARARAGGAAVVVVVVGGIGGGEAFISAAFARQAWRGERVARQRLRGALRLCSRHHVASKKFFAAARDADHS